MTYKKKYDLIFSIGAACSCTQTLRKCRLQYASYPFDWITGGSIVNRCKMLVNNLENFINKKDLIFQEEIEITKCNAYINKYNDILFNHDFKISETFEEGYERVKLKYERRLNRLYKQIENAKNVLVVYVNLPNKENVTDDELKETYEILKNKFGEKINLLYLYNTKDININNRISTKITDNIEKVTFDYNKYDLNVPYAVNFKLLRNYFTLYKISTKYMNIRNYFRRLFFRVRFLFVYIKQLKIEKEAKC